MVLFIRLGYGPPVPPVRMSSEMNRPISVDCSFDKDGSVHVRRIAVDDNWLVVDPGRQWVDEHGRHVLIMIPGGRVFEIVLSSDTLNWKITSARIKSNII